MTSNYEFVPGRGTHYSSRIRSFVLRNQRGRKRAKNHTVRTEEDLDSSGQSQAVATCDSKNLLRGMVDPFNTLGAEIDQYENTMVQRYLSCCIPNMGKIRYNVSFFPPRDIDWEGIRGDSMLISAAVQFAALSLALIELQGQYPVETANRYHRKTLQMVRSRLELEKNRPTDNLLHVIIGLLATDTHIRRFHHPSEQLERDIDLHIRGLQAAMDSRHGWNLALYSPPLQWEFLWQDVVVNGRISRGKTTFSSHIKKSLLIGELLQSGSSFQNQWPRLCVLEFLGAYKNFYQAACQRIRIPPPADHDQIEKLSPEPRELFLPGTAAYRTVSSEEQAIVRPIVPLLLISIMLFSLKEADAEEIAYQYWALRRKFRRCDVEQGSGPAYLCFALGMTAEMKAFTDPDQMELLSRMLSVECGMSQTSQRKLKESLLGFISGSTEEDIRTWWTPDDMRTQLCEELAINCGLADGTKFVI